MTNYQETHTLSRIPDNLRCILCKRTIPRIGLYEVTGYEELRSQGGANKIVGRRRTGKYVCSRTQCLDEARGKNPGTDTLF